jgi:hypothetical protein
MGFCGVGWIIMVPASGCLAGHLPAHCRPSARRRLAKRKGLSFGIRTTVRSAVLTGVGNGKRMSYRAQGLVASPCPALTNNLVGARGKRILSVAGSNLLRSRASSLIWPTLLAFITRPGPSFFVSGPLSEGGAKGASKPQKWERAAPAAHCRSWFKSARAKGSMF